MTDARAKKAMKAAGQWNEDGVWRAARTGRHDCGAWVISGLDDPRCAFVAVCDLTPLSTVGEALALLAGRRTYTLSRVGGRYELDHRGPVRVAADPPGGREVDVLATHQCGAASLPSIRSRIKIRAPAQLPIEAPF